MRKLAERARIYVELHGSSVSMQIFLPTDVGFKGEVAIRASIDTMFNTMYRGNKVGHNAVRNMEQVANTHIGVLYLLARLDVIK